VPNDTNIFVAVAWICQIVPEDEHFLHIPVISITWVMSEKLFSKDTFSAHCSKPGGSISIEVPQILQIKWWWW